MSRADSTGSADEAFRDDDAAADGSTPLHSDSTLPRLASAPMTATGGKVGLDVFATGVELRTD